MRRMNDDIMKLIGIDTRTNKEKRKTTMTMEHGSIRSCGKKKKKKYRKQED